MISVVLMLMLYEPVLAPNTEADYVARIHARNPTWKREVRLWDRTRCDLVNSTHAIEVDWARKWAEAIGQSLHYSNLTGLKPSIVLLCRRGDDVYIWRCTAVAARCNIYLQLEWIDNRRR